MAKFGINDILSAQRRKGAAQQAQTEGYKEILFKPHEVKAAPENTHQKLENIEELADSFLHRRDRAAYSIGARVNGEYRIIDGHRRNAANILNLERGHKEYEKVLYRFMDMSEAMASCAYWLAMDTRRSLPPMKNQISRAYQSGAYQSQGRGRLRDTGQMRDLGGSYVKREQHKRSQNGRNQQQCHAGD